MSKPEISPQRDEFISHLSNIIGITQEKQIDAVLVGGVALRSAMEKPVEFRRANGSIPDFDMIGLGPDLEKIKPAIEEIKKYNESFKNSPRVTLEPVQFSDKKRESYPVLECLSGLRKDSSGRYFLTFRSVEQEIDPLTMTSVAREYGGVEIFTLPKETILYRYYTRMGYLKPKDQLKVEEFGQYIKESGGDNINPNLYLPYIEFCDRISQKHPIPIAVTKFYWNIDQKTKGFFSGSSGFIYDLIGIFRR